MYDALLGLCMLAGVEQFYQVARMIRGIGVVDFFFFAFYWFFFKFFLKKKNKFQTCYHVARITCKPTVYPCATFDFLLKNEFYFVFKTCFFLKNVGN